MDRITYFVPATVLFLLFLSPAAENYDNDTIFPTPAILKDNVEFWKKIYTSVSMNEGLIHDRDHPLVIFKRIPGNSRSKSVRRQKKRIVNALERISSQPESEWGELEHRLVDLYLKHADTGALAGAAGRVRFQMGQKERYREGLIRSGMYLDTIRAILRSYHIPLRLAYLPHVESSFNTEAYSKVGAAGLWQFMRGTGKLYGMRINYTIDERRDPVIATYGAAKYLSSSYEQLGTWPLAITSYNHGVYGMKRAVKQTGSRDIAVIIQKYKSRSFKFASSNFYSCFLAASSIAADFRKYFPDIILKAPVAYNDFVLEHYVTADDFCSFLDIPREQLMMLNPAIRPAVFSKHQRLPKDFVLHIPASKSLGELAAAYRAMPDSLKLETPPRPQYYRVRRGDNLYAISRRLGVSIKELAFENNITRLNRIRAGQVLRVPPKAEITVAYADKKASAAPPAAPTAPDTSVKPPTASSLPSPPDTTATEAVAEIAQAEAEAILPPEEVAMARKEAPPPEEPAAKLTRLPAARKKPESLAAELSDSLKEIAFAPALAQPAGSGTEKPKIGPDFDVGIYDLDAVLSPVGTSARIVISVDETIGHYADWLGIPTWRIRRHNTMGRRSTIRINQKLKIPIDKPDALERFAALRLEYHMAIEEDFYSQYTVGNVVSYTLKRGETLWDICNSSENPLPLWLFRKYNRHLDLNRLFAGSMVWIPQVRELTEDELKLMNSQPYTDRRLPPPPASQQPLKEQELVP